MKKIISYLGVCLFISFLAFSCTKNAIETQTQSEKPQSSDDFDTDDFDYSSEDNQEEDDEIDYSTEASMKIDSAHYPSYRGVDASPFDNCPTHKWDKYLILADEQRIALKGYGFGATRGTSTIKIMYKKTVLPSSIIEYEDWSDTEASFYLNLAGRDTLKNISLKFIIVKDGVEKFKTVKALGATGMQYGTNICNINRIRKKNGKSISGWQTGTYTDVSSSYVPAIGDVLQRASGEKGVVYEIINTPDTKGRIKVKVQTINANCKSGSKKGTWKFKDTFVPKTSEATSGTWVKYFH